MRTKDARCLLRLIFKDSSYQCGRCDWPNNMINILEAHNTASDHNAVLGTPSSSSEEPWNGQT